MLCRFLGTLLLVTILGSACKPIWKDQQDPSPSDADVSGQALTQTGALQDWKGQSDLTEGAWAFVTIE
ncbi:MAG: hypothetical protein ACOVS5_08680 [Oligoflexus sp.]|jgi:hypothetical protein